MPPARCWAAPIPSPAPSRAATAWAASSASPPRTSTLPAWHCRPGGVYAVHAAVGGQTCRAVLNIGVRPTLQNPHPQLRVETHLIDFVGDLYGQELEVAFVDKLRDERAFPSLAELRDQIARDILEAQLRF